MISKHVPLLMVGAAVILSGSLATAVGPQPAFRVDTDIYLGASKEPTKQTLTLFSDGVYYDFSVDDPNAVTMVDPQRQRIILLDAKRHIKTTVNMPDLLKLVDAARVGAGDEGLGLLLEAAERAEFDETTNTLSVGITEMLYRATTQTPKEPVMATQYADFADWSARLNAVYPPLLPPYVRMRLNSELGQRGLLPAEILRSSQVSGRVHEVRCHLIANWRLSSDDQAKIKRVGQMLAEFNELDNALFFAQQK